MVFNRMAGFGTACAAVICSGCANWGDIVTPPMANSAHANADIVCVDVSHVPTAESSAIPGISAVGESVLAWGYDALVAAGKKEAGRYSASYSGQTNATLYQRNTDSVVVWRPPASITVTRYSAQEPRDTKPACGGGVKDIEVVFFLESRQLNVPVAAGDKSKASPAYVKGFEYRLVPKSLSLWHTKAKAPDVSALHPWTWAILASRDLQLIDLNIRLDLSTDVYDQNGIGGKATIASVDFPVGKIQVPNGESSTDLDKTALEALASSWFKLPLPAQVPGYSCNNDVSVCEAAGNLTVVASLKEANDLGDVLSKQLEDAEDKKNERVSSAAKRL